MNTGEVWWVRFPYDDNPQKYKVRPAIVLDDGQMGVLSVKVTKHEPRDSFDVSLFEWTSAGLSLSSTARISKTVVIERDMFLNFIGMLSENDLNRVLSKYMEYASEHVKSEEAVERESKLA